MRRLRFVGLCVVAVLALGAVFAAAAQAKKVKPITGPFKLTSTTKEASLITTGATVKCKKGTDVGEVTGPTTGVDTVTFEECETLGKKCTSAGATVGDIKTFELENETGWISKENDEVGLDFKPGPENATYLAEFECEGLAIKVKGSVIGHIGPANVMAETSSEVFTGTGVKQEPTSFEGGPEDVLKTITSLTGEEELKSLQKVEGSTQNAEIEEVGKKDKIVKRKDPTEIWTIGGTPEFGRCQAHKKGKYADSNCTTVKEKKGKPAGSYEFEPV